MRAYLLLMLIVSLASAEAAFAVGEKRIPEPAGSSPAPMGAPMPGAYVRPQVPMVVPNGGENLTSHWLEHGGARIYWNTLNQPLQLKLAGARFADPATLPELINTGGDSKKGATARRRSSRRSVAARQAPGGQRPPAGAGSPSLKTPEKKTGAAAGRPSAPAPGGGGGGATGGGTAGQGAMRPQASGDGIAPTTYTNLERPGPRAQAPAAAPATASIPANSAFTAGSAPASAGAPAVQAPIPALLPTAGGAGAATTAGQAPVQR